MKGGVIIRCLIFFICLIFHIFLFDAGAQTRMTGEDPPSLEAVDALMSKKSIANCQKAIKGYQALLANNPNDPDLLIRLTYAHVLIIDITTSALIEERDEYKPMLKDLGKTAYDYAHRACELRPGDSKAVALCLVSYGYYSAGFGILKAVFKGAAGRYKELCNRLIKLEEGYAGGLAYRMLGKFYHVAPWPAGSGKKALKFYKKAVETDPSVLYPHYYLGQIYFKKKKYDTAKKEFAFVVDNNPTEHESHFIKAYKQKSRQYLARIAATGH